jgi:hypothetical protein
MMTFTLPRELRKLAKSHQNIIRPLLFKTAVATLKAFGLNEKNINTELAMTAILHTHIHTRRLGHHPHVHILVPGGDINTQRTEWRKVQGDYLFNSFKLAAAFRGAMLTPSSNRDCGYLLRQKNEWSMVRKWVVEACAKVLLCTCIAGSLATKISLLMMATS